MIIKYGLTILFFHLFIQLNAQKKNIKSENFKVYGTCEQCKHRIENALLSYGVYKANWDIDTKMLEVSYDSTRFTKAKLEQKLASIGHDTEDFQAKDKTYFSLPKCCYYERYQKPFPAQTNGSPQNISTENDALHTVTGIVLEEDKKGKLLPLLNATVRCLNSNHAGRTDSLGVFQLPCVLPVQVEVSYVGFTSDTLNIISPNEIKIILKNASSNNLKEVVINARNRSTYVSSLSTFNTMNIGSRELTKAACCNLSESFETSPSVDVSYADGVTGVKQIQLLGLSGNYTQLLTENIPEIRGLAGYYGLSFIPGPWIEGIQLTKGVGSVVNGYESIAGQINIEEKKPDKMDKIFINAYSNNDGRMELNTNLSHKLNDKWSTALLAHIDAVAWKTDANKDGFLDMPLGRQLNFINRWKYQDENGWIAQFGIKALNDHKQAGQWGFNPSTDKFTTNAYGVGMDIQQYELSGKLGYIFPEQKYKSIGLILSAIDYNNNSYFGFSTYTGKQKSIYANLIYQSIIHSTIHKFRTGFSFMNDQYAETMNANDFKRSEIVPGAFFEYTYTPGTKFSLIAGIREDYHNQFGLVTTPRVHLKYDFAPNTNLRLSAGSGFRMANIFAENMGDFISSRQYSIVGPSSNYGYGLNPEKAWNYGLNFIHHFDILHHHSTFSFDAYRTDFTKQVIVDVDASPQKILFYNLQGKSFSNSIQGELNMELMEGLDMRLAYRWLDVESNYHGTMMEKPLIAKHRAFVNFAYETKSHWKFDYTVQWFSKKRLPNTASNPDEYRLANFSPSYFQMSGQVTKQFGTKWDIYLGAENITNFMQNPLIVSAAQPFGPYFDASMVWGPANGRIVYLGMRMKM